MSKVALKVVDVVIVVEMNLAEATAVRDELGRSTGQGTYEVFDKLDDAVNEALRLTKGVD